MIDGETVGRGLHVLGDATTSELAAFLGTSEADVRDATSARPDLFEAVDGASRPWRLSREGRERLRRAPVPIPPTDAVGGSAAEGRLLAALAAVEEDLAHLRGEPEAPEADDFLDLLDLRVRAVRKAVRRLAEDGRPFPAGVERLVSATRVLRHLRERRLAVAAETPIREVETSVERYVRDWSGLWTGIRKSIPDRADAGPLVVVDCAIDGGDVVERIGRMATLAKSPFIVISAKERASAHVERDLERLGAWVSGIAGAAARMVLVVDGRGLAARELAARFVRLDGMRASSRHELASGSVDDDLWTVMRATLRLARLSGGEEGAFVDVYEHRVSSLARHVTWALLRMVEPAGKEGRPMRSWYRPEAMSVCIDTSSDALFATVFRGSAVSYVGLSELGDKAGFVRPLDGPVRGLPMGNRGALGHAVPYGMALAGPAAIGAVLALPAPPAAPSTDQGAAGNEETSPGQHVEQGYS